MKVDVVYVQRLDQNKLIDSRLTTTLFIEMPGEWCHFSPRAPVNMNCFMSLSRAYAKYYKNTNSIDLDNLIELMKTEDTLKGYRLIKTNKLTLYISIIGKLYNKNLYLKRINSNKINEFLDSKYFAYSFNGVVDKNSLDYYKGNNMVAHVDKKMDLSIPKLTELLKRVLDSKDDLINPMGMCFALDYILNLHPEKLDFLINDKVTYT